MRPYNTKYAIPAPSLQLNRHSPAISTSPFQVGSTSFPSNNNTSVPSSATTQCSILIGTRNNSPPITLAHFSSPPSLLRYNKLISPLNKMKISSVFSWVCHADDPPNLTSRIEVGEPREWSCAMDSGEYVCVIPWRADVIDTAAISSSSCCSGGWTQVGSRDGTGGGRRVSWVVESGLFRRK